MLTSRSAGQMGVSRSLPGFIADVLGALAASVVLTVRAVDLTEQLADRAFVAMAPFYFDNDGAVAFLGYPGLGSE